MTANTELRLQLQSLDLAKLEKTSAQGLIGCPFSKFYRGTIAFQYRRLSENEALCKSCCGALFPRGYQKFVCPCEVMPKTYVKQRFWKMLQKANEQA